MKQRLLAVVLLAAGVALVTVPLFAHHGGAVYDSSKWTTLTGTVTKFEFVNPHILISIDVKGANGEIQHWAIEHSPPSISARAGWYKEMCKAGDEIVYQVHAARNGAFVGSGAGSMIVNGKKVPASEGGTGGSY